MGTIVMRGMMPLSVLNSTRGQLHSTLALAGVPRDGLSAEQKLAFEQQLMAATSKATFKAQLKQLCGGKKKITECQAPRL